MPALLARSIARSPHRRPTIVNNGEANEVSSETSIYV
jgi:hypothetical protein